MPTITLKPRQFGPALRRRLKADHKKVMAAALEVLKQSEDAAVRTTNDEGLVHLGPYKWGWEVVRVEGGWQLQNNTPYAGVIEHGRRPGRPGPPFEPILEWVERKLVANGEVEPEEAWDLAWAIRASIHKNGTRPRFVLRTAVMGLRARFAAEVLRRLRER